MFLENAVKIMFAVVLLTVCGPATADQGGPFEWRGVERIVAIGDLHGDYEQYQKVMRDAGLINPRGKWTGGKTHLVQTGDVVDRGPDSMKIIEHLQDLRKQAQRKGGRVHTLIGNHEAMISYGDLRYVHAGEYQYFTNRKSAALRERQWEYTLQQMQQSRPDEFAQLDLDSYRQEWEQQYPLGWVEHRTAWMPGGPFGDWMLQNPVAVMIDGNIFLHGGLSAKYCHMSLGEITERVHRELREFDPQEPGMIEDPEGPLWYRGLAQDNEQVLRPVVEAILERYGARRIVVGHTPTGGVVWPRFDGRVVANDTGIAAYYGSHDGFLELRGDQALAGYGDARLELPGDAAGREAYLRAVIELEPDNTLLQKRLEQLLSPWPEETEPTGETEEPRAEGAEVFNPGICQ
jgi:hypothetical protein